MQHTDIDNISNKLDEICDLETDVQIVEGFTDLKLSYIPVIKELLSELRILRNKDRQHKLSMIIKGTHRVVVEGFSAESVNGAFQDAMNKVMHYFSEQNDVSITVLELLELPKKGYKAVLEVHITPFTETHKATPVGQDEEILKINEADYQKRKKHAEGHLDELVLEHFIVSTGTVPAHIPDYVLINIHDADLLNMMIEKDFFKASHEDINIDHKILVKFQTPEPKPEPE